MVNKISGYYVGLVMGDGGCDGWRYEYGYG